MNYDPSFDQARLNQLAAQCLANNSAKGKVIFLSDSEDNTLDVASFRFDEPDAIEHLIASGFKTYLIGLLDTLLINRAEHNQPNASQGIVYVDGDRIDLKWVTRDEAEALR